MLVNLLLMDGKSNYMEGLMRESTKRQTLADDSHCAIPCHRPLVHSLVREYDGEWHECHHVYTRYPNNDAIFDFLS